MPEKNEQLLNFIQGHPIWVYVSLKVSQHFKKKLVCSEQDPVPETQLIWHIVGAL